MAEIVNRSDSLTNKLHFKKETVVKKYRRSLKSIKRRNRRKRNKLKYYKSLNTLRVERKTSDLCAAIEVFDITDMDWASSCSLQSLPGDVTEWQKQDQIAYWKSRAVSLEFENRMLHQHLRNVYAKQIQDYEQYYSATTIIKNQVEINKNNNSSLDSKQDNSKESSLLLVVPKVPEGKNRAEEMKKIYGDEAQKIMGMETAIQLNYERHLELGKPGYWPNLPLKL